MQIGERKFVHGEDFFRLNGSTGGALSKPLVFVGNGWMVKSKNIDAHAGVDVAGKIAVIQITGMPRNESLRVLPEGVTQADLKPEARGTEWADPIFYARQKGAAGVIAVASPELQNFWSRLKEAMSEGSPMRIEGLHTEKSSAGNAQQSQMPVLLISQTAGNALFAGEKANPVENKQAMTAFAFAGNKNFSVNASSKAAGATTQNVVGMIEGSDPTLKSEIVAIGAHYDHDGIGKSVPARCKNGPRDDLIYNGADDDGSGTVAVLSIAEALAKSPRKPKRSILFVWHAGEEKGLWGSAYFAKFPTVDLSKVVTQLNIDMIGRSKAAGDTKEENKDLSGPNEIYVIGSKMMSTELGNVSEAVNNSYLNLNYNYKYDDPKDPNRFFFRSDHFNYAQKGIPIIFWFDGVHEDYHCPSDSPDKIDYAKMEKVARTIFATMWEIADGGKRPTVDKKLPAELTGQ
jgi:Zn-dependent M28 family amino/carboxypeptidase